MNEYCSIRLIPQGEVDEEDVKVFEELPAEIAIEEGYILEVAISREIPSGHSFETLEPGGGEYGSTFFALRPYTDGCHLTIEGVNLQEIRALMNLSWYMMGGRDQHFAVRYGALDEGPVKELIDQNTLI